VAFDGSAKQTARVTSAQTVGSAVATDWSVAGLPGQVPLVFLVPDQIAEGTCVGEPGEAEESVDPRALPGLVERREPVEALGRADCAGPVGARAGLLAKLHGLAAHLANPGGPRPGQRRATEQEPEGTDEEEHRAAGHARQRDVDHCSQRNRRGPRRIPPVPARAILAVVENRTVTVGRRWRSIAACILAASACGKSVPAERTSPVTGSAVGSNASTRGRVVRGKHHSDALGVDKNYVVYLPAGYDGAPRKRWPTFYYLHGLTSPEDEWIELGKLDAAADALGLDAIVVMPDGDDGFYTDSASPIDHDACMKDGSGLFDPGADRAATCVRHRAYETYVVKELIAHIDATYRTIASRDGRAIAGVSMGGFGAWSLALRHPDLFAAAASHSGLLALLYAGPHPYVAGKVQLITDPSKWNGPPAFARWLHMVFGPDLANWKAHDPAALVQTLAPGGPALYLDCGTEDFIYEHTAYVHDLLVARGIEHVFFVGPGEHEYTFWVPRVRESLAFLRAHTTAAR